MALSKANEQIAQLSEDISNIKAAVPRRTTPPFPVWDASEPSVQSVFHDLVRPTDVVFDVGAHIGSLSSVLARMVGPKGLVVSFEAALATAMQLNTNIVANGHRNVCIIHGAVFSEQGALIALSDNGAASRIADDGVETVETVQLDDFCQANGLAPSFIKMDIEGAEYDALRGAPWLLAQHKPHIVFEHNVGDDRALHLLRDFGYIFFDASTYRRVLTSEDCEPGVAVTNIIAIHGDRVGATPYRSDPKVKLVTAFRFLAVPGRNDIASYIIELDRGRYFIRLSGEISDKAETLFSRVSTRQQCLGQLYTEAKFFMQNHRNLTLQANQSGQYVVEVGEVNSLTGAPTALSGELYRIEFD